MKIGVFGIGLIGGSLSIQARKHFTDSKIYGFDLSNKNLNRALKLGLIDAILDSNEIKNYCQEMWFLEDQIIKT